MLAAKRYARAVFELGESRGRIDAYGEGLAWVAELLNRHPEMLEFFGTPSIPDGEKKTLVGEVGEGSIPVTVLRLLYVLIDQGSMSLAADIHREYDLMVALSRHQVVCHVQVASPLDDYVDLTAYLTRETGNDVLLDVTVEPSLLGGFVARVGDRIIDASIRGRLEKMKASIWQGV